MVFTTAIVAHCFFAASTAQVAVPAGQSDQTSRQIDDMARRLETLEKRNADLQSQVVDLKAQSGDQWLTQERAAEVRAIVQDVLSDSATRSSMQSNGATAGWDNGFFIASADNRFRLEVGGLVQARYVWSSQRSPYVTSSQIAPNARINFDKVENRSGFDVHNTELWAQGHVISPDIQYMIKGIFTQNQDMGVRVGNPGATPNPQPFITNSTAGGIQLLDAWVRVNLTDDWSIRVGQFRAPFGREFLVLEQFQMAVDRSLVSLHYGMGYTQGLELEYLSNEARWRFSVNDGGTDMLAGPAQVVGSQPMNSSWDAQTVSWGLTTRFDWKGSGGWAQFDQFTSPDGSEPGWLWGVAMNAQVTKPNESLPLTSGAGTDSNSNGWIGFTTDFTWQFGGASLFASAYYNYVNSNAAYLQQNAAGATYVDAGEVNALGFTLQAAMYLAPKWEVFSRYEYMHTTATNSAEPALLGNVVDNYLFQQHHMDVVTIGVNYYLDGQDVKITTDFGFGLTPMYPAYAVPATGWRVSESDEFVVRAQMQLLF